MARTVGDVALMLSTIAGPDPRSPIALETPGMRFAEPLDRDFGGVRMAWSPDLGGLPVDPAVSAALAPQRAVLESIGCTVEEEEPDFDGADEAFKRSAPGRSGRRSRCWTDIGTSSRTR